MPSGARGARPCPGESGLLGVVGRVWRSPSSWWVLAAGQQVLPAPSQGRGRGVANPGGSTGTQHFWSSGWLPGGWLLQEPGGSPQSSQRWWGRDADAQVLGSWEAHGKIMFEAWSPSVVTEVSTGTELARLPQRDSIPVP